MIRRSMSCLVAIGLLFHSYISAKACGPSYLQPIFVFEESPDLPLQEFAAGKIGIVRPTFGRKTLLIAYRYLNGGSFAPDEQNALVEALEGQAPENEGEPALKAWISARKEYLHEEEPPELYTERRHHGYDFFPNCAKNAFEVATTTLKDRLASYGASDPYVREWMRGQDQVFQNCSGATEIPRELGPEAPLWLRQDRDYQIAASLLYSLQFDQARARFEKIAADSESNWSATGEYLVGRTLVRQASLTQDEKRKRELYADAERHLQKLIDKGHPFGDASRKLLALIKYRMYPEERVQELADHLTIGGISQDLRQEVIDYVWLLDKFEAQILKEEHQRKEALKEKKPGETLASVFERNGADEAVVRGELISIWFSPKLADETYDYRNNVSFQVKYDTPASEIIKLLEEKLSRNLTPEENSDIKERIKWSLESRKWLISQNRKLDAAARDYEGCYNCYDLKLQLADVSPFLLTKDLTDWILTFQNESPEAYTRALSRWRETESQAWLLAALTKADATSPEVIRLMRAAERIGFGSPAFPTIVFQLVRLKMALGKTVEAQQLLDSIVTTQFDELPVSAQNQFRAQGMQLAKTLSQFLKSAARRPVAFYDEGLYRTISEMLVSRKAEWSKEEFDESKDEYERRLERQYQSLVSQDLRLFDDRTADILDRHFSLQMLNQAAHDPNLSSYLRRRLMLVVWVRAILLKNDELATESTPDVIKVAPEMSSLLTQYLQTQGPAAREHLALYILLKFPGLSPFIAGTLPEPSTAEDSDYDFETAWWCKPSETEYRSGNEVGKIVPAPRFLEPSQLETAQREYATLSAIGDAKSYLGKRVLQWAKSDPSDPRIPEALFIAGKANQSYKYGCNGWENDKETEQEAIKILSEQYPQSPWTAKLEKREDR